jgi:hypothetical protein
MRFVYASDEAVAYVRENAKQSIVVLVTRGSDKKIALAKDAVPGLQKAVNIYGGGKIKADGKTLLLPGQALAVNVWRVTK